MSNFSFLVQYYWIYLFCSGIVDSSELAPINLHYFDSDASKGSQFIEDFHKGDHHKITFDGNTRMTRLLSILDGDAQKVFSIRSNRRMQLP